MTGLHRGSGLSPQPTDARRARGVELEANGPPSRPASGFLPSRRIRRGHPTDRQDARAPRALLGRCLVGGRCLVDGRRARRRAVAGCRVGRAPCGGFGFLRALAVPSLSDGNLALPLRVRLGASPRHTSPRSVGDDAVAAASSDCAGSAGCRLEGVRAHHARRRRRQGPDASFAARERAEGAWWPHPTLARVVGAG